MVKQTPLLIGLAVAASVAAMASWAYSTYGIPTIATTTPAPAASATRNPWTATAPGRVEPRNGEVRLTALAPGRIAELAVRLNDRVSVGDLLVRLDDDEQRARISAADAEVAARRRDRDNETVGRLAQDRRQAEDNVAASERTLITQRFELDRLARLLRSGGGGVTDEAVAAQRTAVAAAVERVEQDRAALRRAQSASGVPAQTRLEAAVSASRADVAIAEAAWERTRVRAPSDGTVLQILARAGETAAATPEQPLLVIGDLTALRVRAELEERDIAKVRVSQSVVVRSDAFPGLEFSGRITTLAQAVAPARIAQRGPRRPNEQDTIEVMIDLEGNPSLLPGMRVDVFFKADNTVQSTPPPATR